GGTCPRWASATTSTREAGAGTPQARNPVQRPQAPVVFDFCRLAVDVCDRVISSLTLRVNYSETDQMGVVYHANYLIWFDRARTELMRETGVTYKELEQQGVYLAVSEVNVRFRAAARYDDLVRVRCWVRELPPRRHGRRGAAHRRTAGLERGRAGGRRVRVGVAQRWACRRAARGARPHRRRRAAVRGGHRPREDRRGAGGARRGGPARCQGGGRRRHVCGTAGCATRGVAPRD